MENLNLNDEMFRRGMKFPFSYSLEEKALFVKERLKKQSLKKQPFEKKGRKIPRKLEDISDTEMSKRWRKEVESFIRRGVITQQAGGRLLGNGR